MPRENMGPRRGRKTGFLAFLPSREMGLLEVGIGTFLSNGAVPVTAK